MNYEILVATTNKNKVKEIREILSPHKITVYGINDLNLPVIDVVEDGKNYLENATKKAAAYAELVSMPVIADDSGIEVDALNGEPGLESARFAKSHGGYDEAMKYIISKCQETNNYRAKFLCTIVAMNIDNKPLIFEGTVSGNIVTKIEGSKGFGYDPVFQSDELDKPFSLVDDKIKNKYSHRGKALIKFITYLKINGHCI